uniref:Histone acetyltransferase GCN5 n=1 Tax=Macrostomum lignano TaxID=282301 RepID=A0A1I8H3S4_9PLAT
MSVSSTDSVDGGPVDVGSDAADVDAAVQLMPPKKRRRRQLSGGVEKHIDNHRRFDGGDRPLETDGQLLFDSAAEHTASSAAQQLSKATTNLRFDRAPLRRSASADDDNVASGDDNVTGDEDDVTGGEDASSGENSAASCAEGAAASTANDAGAGEAQAADADTAAAPAS